MHAHRDRGTGCAEHRACFWTFFGALACPPSSGPVATPCAMGDYAPCPFRSCCLMEARHMSTSLVNADVVQERDVATA